MVVSRVIPLELHGYLHKARNLVSHAAADPEKRMVAAGSSLGRKT